MSQPAVSVIMSTFNRKHFLKECIDSVLNQTFTDFEFIIVDDASTDGSEKLICSYTDPRIRFIRQEKNRRLAYEQNFAFPLAKGRYLAKMDSDDVWKPEKLEKQYAYMETHPECAVCFTYADFIDGNSQQIDPPGGAYEGFHTSYKTQKEWMHRFFFKGNGLVNPTSFMRKEIFEKFGPFDVRFQVAEDLEYWVRVVSQYPIYVIPEELHSYRWMMDDMQMSTLSYDNIQGLTNLMGLMRLHFFDWMSDEDFVEWFQDYFVNHDSRTKMELRCEKAFLSKNYTFNGIDMTPVAAVLLGDIMRDGGIDVLEERFGFTVGDYNQLLKTFCFSNLPGFKTKKEEIEAAQNHAANLQTELDAIKSTKVWRLRCKLRRLLGKK